MITTEDSSTATRVAASTRGTTSAWIGLIPITRSASSSSRIVRAPRSAHIAVAPAPATTSTVTIGPTWVTVREGSGGARRSRRRRTPTAEC